ncbi:MAG TPA: double zinc ribbon domain-containing protein [Anaerolineales bacterium]|nr:double zinc ribbon domain-containing protein [Anaerolineales bacterium]
MEGTPARLHRRWLQRWVQAGLDFLYPPRCAGCGAMGPDWCEACQTGLRRLRGPLCPRCGAPRLGPRSCAACRTLELPLTVRSYARYEGALARAILHLKYRPNPRLAARMAGWLAELCGRETWRPSLVVPVPLSKERRRRRGYNQMDLVAKALAGLLGLPCKTDALSRVRDTRSQVGLDAVARHRNVQDAFQARREAVQGSVILLVDDLFTTGATLAACAAALREAGSGEVYALTVGRAASGF